MSITRHYSESGFAFVAITADEAYYSNADDADREPIVACYDLEFTDEVPIPGEPDVRGRFLCSWYRDSLIAFAERNEDLQLHAGIRSLVIPAGCLRNVARFLSELP